MLEQFYEDLWPSEGGTQRIVATLKNKRIQYNVLNSQFEVIPFLKSFNEYDTYHALGNYQGIKPGKIKALVNDLIDKKTGKLIEAANIKSDSCTGIKSFGFDLDVGEGHKKYDQLEDAYQALAKAAGDKKIPEPTWLLFSGGGLQFTYVLNTSESSAQVLGGLSKNGLPESEWLTRFSQLHRHLAQYLKVDSIGSRPHSLLRSPCTPNWKYGEPVMPQILNEVRGPELDPKWFDKLTAAAPKTKVATATDSAIHVTNPLQLKQVLKACNAMKQMYIDEGANSDYNEWTAAANICAHTFESSRGFHRLSRGHAEYTPEDTKEKFDNIRLTASAGPWGCEYFGNVDDPDSPCHGCWAAKRGLTNPISAARNYSKKPAATVKKTPIDTDVLDELSEDVVPEHDEIHGIPAHHLPEGYYINEKMIITDGKNEACQLFHVRALQFNADKGEGNLAVSKDKEEWHTLSAKKLAMPAACSAELMNVGIMVYNDKATMHYVRHGSLLDPMSNEAGYYGWHNEMTSAYLPTGDVGDSSSKPSKELQKLSKRWGSIKGSLDGWMEAVKIYERTGQEPYMMALLASLASPLLKYFPGLEMGVILSLTGEGGVGKTSALQVASSVWGKDLKTLAGADSTYTAVRIYLDMCGNLPMILDDITQMPAEDLKKMALDISQGTGREKGHKDGGLQDSQTWQLNLITTSNTSLHNKLAELVDMGSADMNRVIELPISASAHVSLEQGKEMLEGIEDNHGLLGERWMQHLLTLDREKELKLFRQLHKKLRMTDGLKGSDRFVDGLIVACYWAHKQVKIIEPNFPGDPEQMFLWMRRQLLNNNKMIEQVLQVRIPEVDDFIASFMADGLVISKTARGYDSQGTSMKGYVFDLGDELLVPKETLDSWARRNSLKTRTVLDRWGNQTKRLHNFAGEGAQPRFTAKFKEGIMVNGEKLKPTAIIIRKEFNDKDTEAGNTNVTPIDKALKNNR